MSDKLEELLEQEGFAIHKHETCYELKMFTPAGEDWIIGITNLEDFVEYADNFDPEEEFAMWMEARQGGFRGVPSPSVLWKDQLWKQKELKKIAKKITKLLKSSK